MQTPKPLPPEINTILPLSSLFIILRIVDSHVAWLRPGHGNGGTHFSLPVHMYSESGLFARPVRKLWCYGGRSNFRKLIVLNFLHVY